MASVSEMALKRGQFITLPKLIGLRTQINLSQFVDPFRCSHFVPICVTCGSRGSHGMGICSNSKCPTRDHEDPDSICISWTSLSRSTLRFIRWEEIDRLIRIKVPSWNPLPVAPIEKDEEGEEYWKCFQCGTHNPGNLYSRGWKTCQKCKAGPQATEVPIVKPDPSKKAPANKSAPSRRRTRSHALDDLPPAKRTRSARKVQK